MKRFNTLLLALSLGLGSVVSAGCVAAPAIMLTSAAVTAVAVVSEGERLVQYPDAGTTAFVQNDTGEVSACNQTCLRDETREEERPDA